MLKSRMTVRLCSSKCALLLLLQVPKHGHAAAAGGGGLVDIMSDTVNVGRHSIVQVGTALLDVGEHAGACQLCEAAALSFKCTC